MGWAHSYGDNTNNHATHDAIEISLRRYADDIRPGKNTWTFYPWTATTTFTARALWVTQAVRRAFRHLNRITPINVHYRERLTNRFCCRDTGSVAVYHTAVSCRLQERLQFVGVQRGIMLFSIPFTTAWDWRCDEDTIYPPPPRLHHPASPTYITKTHTHTLVNDQTLRGPLLFFPLSLYLTHSYRLCTRMTSKDRWEQRTDSRGPIVPIEKCPQRVWPSLYTPYTHTQSCVRCILRTSYCSPLLFPLLLDKLF